MEAAPSNSDKAIERLTKSTQTLTLEVTTTTVETQTGTECSEAATQTNLSQRQVETLERLAVRVAGFQTASRAFAQVFGLDPDQTGIVSGPTLEQARFRRERLNNNESGQLIAAASGGAEIQLLPANNPESEGPVSTRTTPAQRIRVIPKSDSAANSQVRPTVYGLRPTPYLTLTSDQAKKLSYQSCSPRLHHLQRANREAPPDRIRTGPIALPPTTTPTSIPPATLLSEPLNARDRAKELATPIVVQTPGAADPSADCCLHKTPTLVSRKRCTSPDESNFILSGLEPNKIVGFRAHWDHAKPRKNPNSLPRQEVHVIGYVPERVGGFVSQVLRATPGLERVTRRVVDGVATLTVVTPPSPGQDRPPSVIDLGSVFSITLQQGDTVVSQTEGQGRGFNPGNPLSLVEFSKRIIRKPDGGELRQIRYSCVDYCYSPPKVATVFESQYLPYYQRHHLLGPEPTRILRSATRGSDSRPPLPTQVKVEPSPAAPPPSPTEASTVDSSEDETRSSPSGSAKRKNFQPERWPNKEAKLAQPTKPS